jgi:hypothetical protein
MANEGMVTIPLTTRVLTVLARVKLKLEPFLCPAMISLIAGCQFAYSQSLDEINKREEAVVEAWEKTPLTVRRAIFVTEPPKSFGIYKPRSSSQFKSGESIIVYAEPVGFGWKTVEDDQFEFGFNVDLTVKTADGKLVGEQDNFAKLAMKSRYRNREFMLQLTLDLNNALPGDYLLDYKLHDLGTEKTTTVELPFTIEQ